MSATRKHGEGVLNALAKYDARADVFLKCLAA